MHVGTSTMQFPGYGGLTILHRQMNSCSFDVTLLLSDVMVTISLKILFTNIAGNSICQVHNISNKKGAELSEGSNQQEVQKSCLFASTPVKQESHDCECSPLSHRGRLSART